MILLGLQLVSALHFSFMDEGDVDQNHQNLNPFFLNQEAWKGGRRGKVNLLETPKAGEKADDPGV